MARSTSSLGSFNPDDRRRHEPHQLAFALEASVGGLRGLVMGPMVQRSMDSEVRSLERVKEILEA